MVLTALIIAWWNPGRACCTSSPFLGESEMGIKPKGPMFLLHEVGKTEALLYGYSSVQQVSCVEEYISNNLCR